MKQYNEKGSAHGDDYFIWCIFPKATTSSTVKSEASFGLQEIPKEIKTHIPEKEDVCSMSYKFLSHMLAIFNLVVLLIIYIIELDLPKKKLPGVRLFEKTIKLKILTHCGVDITSFVFSKCAAQYDNYSIQHSIRCFNHYYQNCSHVKEFLLLFSDNWVHVT